MVIVGYGCLQAVTCRIKNSIPNEGENIDSVRCSCFIAGIRWGTDGTKELNFVGYIVY